jgi:RNA polymerase sigma-70 factor (ECF subfamily)
MTRAEIEGLYRQYGAFVLRRARTLLGDEAMALDAMQDVFTALVSGSEQFRKASSPLTYLYQVTTHRCLNLIRNRATQERLLEQEHAGEGSVDGPESKLAVAELLRALPADLQEIAVYYYVDQMDQQEIANLTGLSRRTIGNRLDEFKQRARAVGGAT